MILNFKDTSIPLSIQIRWAGYEFIKEKAKNRINNLHIEICDLYCCGILTEKERDRAFFKLYELIEKCVKPMEMNNENL